MKLAAISDIHGNLPALDAVLADIAAHGVSTIVNLGDILSGPLWGAATAERLMALKLPTIAGNHERQLLTHSRERMSASDAHTADELQPHHRAWLASLPASLQLSAEVFCCHGTPTSDLSYFLETVVPGFAGIGSGANGVRAATLAEASARAGSAMQGIAHALILCGHTHVPRMLRLADGRLIVNPGSVGLQGYDDDHGHPHVIETRAPHARYALLERAAAGWHVSLRAVAYDWESAAQRAEREGRPDWAAALRTGFVTQLEGAAT
ncbi:MAG TPA: metallophosphoesterase family protein [Burkholderiaceae bacterium]|nr:metallophosphoesterase family protein [Burkholderiaceae bacterium]